MEGAARRERKVVSVLFADLVGFTQRAEQLDPEDVEAILRPYHERLRSELERFGGTVEKFIGDAVMALFGAPVAQEDAPERAVRAALAIRDWAQDEGVEVRAAVTTGEALVRLDVRPETGEGMAAGDVVNTAARLQVAAPVNGVLVGETTYRATRDAIEYRQAAHVTAKGKAAPVPVWEAVQARARFGVDVARAHMTPLVGREREVAVLREALARVRAERSPQLVTIVGAPGMGKSRLVYELMQLAGVGPELTIWRQGRSLPYGESVSFWSLAEMVKAQAGILDGDPEDVAQQKLVDAVEDLVDDKPQWVVRHLRPLIGLATDETSVSSTERFAAWRRLFEALAERTPAVLVFEDLHWADDGLLDFVDYLVEWATGVPILLVGTARLELLERRPAWGGGKLNATTLALAPLADEDTARLVGALLKRPVFEVEEQVALLERAGGNPLYAEQYARLLSERGAVEELPLPENVQGIIAARLDRLTADEKRLIQNASVFGKVFWDTAIATAGRDDPEIASSLHSLERKDLVQRARRSSVADSDEYAFRHVLVRDVAYGQIPRAERSELHRGAADWFESLGRPEDHAETIAHHRLTALELARTAGMETVELERSARFALRDAGDRASTLNAFSSAVPYFRAALELWPDDADRGYLLFAYGRALRFAEDRGDDTLLEARDRLVAAGDGETAAEVLLVAVDLFNNRGQRDVARTYLEEAVGLVAEAGVSRARALVLARLAQFHMLGGDTAAALAAGEQAFVLATELGLDPIRAHVLNTLGTVRADAGDRGGLDQLQESLELSLALNSPSDILRGYLNLAHCFSWLGEMARSWYFLEEGIRAAERFGERGTSRMLRANRPLYYLHTGDWEEAIRLADEFIAEMEGGLPSGHGQASLSARGYIRWGRDAVSGAISDVERALEIGRGHGSPDHLAAELAMLAYMLVQAGEERRAHGVLDELLELARAANMPHLLGAFQAVLACRDLGRTDELKDALDRGTSSPSNDAAQFGADGRFSDAAEIYERVGDSLAEAELRLRAARQLTEAGQRLEADVQLEKSLAFWRRAGATRYIREGQALLSATA
jgi:class 3 adenylate cyclase/tetratricopeptide (TPR) repeat protein